MTDDVTPVQASLRPFSVAADQVGAICGEIDILLRDPRLDSGLRNGVGDLHEKTAVEGFWYYVTRSKLERLVRVCGLVNFFSGQQVAFFVLGRWPLPFWQ